MPLTGGSHERLPHRHTRVPSSPPRGEPQAPPHPHTCVLTPHPPSDGKSHERFHTHASSGPRGGSRKRLRTGPYMRPPSSPSGQPRTLFHIHIHTFVLSSPRGGHREHFPHPHMHVRSILIPGKESMNGSPHTSTCFSLLLHRMEGALHARDSTGSHSQPPRFVPHFSRSVSCTCGTCAHAREPIYTPFQTHMHVPLHTHTYKQLPFLIGWIHTCSFEWLI